MLVILAAVDAAFSGDWSRIGILSRDAELGLRPLLGLLGLFHLACGAVTALDASQKGFNPVPQTLKAVLLPCPWQHDPMPLTCYLPCLPVVTHC